MTGSFSGWLLQNPYEKYEFVRWDEYPLINSPILVEVSTPRTNVSSIEFVTWDDEYSQLNGKICYMFQSSPTSIYSQLMFNGASQPAKNNNKTRVNYTSWMVKGNATPFNSYNYGFCW